MILRFFSTRRNFLRNIVNNQLRCLCSRHSKMIDENLKIRPDPVVTKLNNSLFQSIFTPDLNALVDLFKKYNYEIRIAGGAVRDILMDKKPTDLDFATTATPTQMKEMFEKEQIRMINMNGEKHGTITARLNEENFECTTLRIDVVTDGRHAEVEFTKDWLLDANRRDLTINAMYLGFDGSVYDYFYGYEDLLEKKVRFVGDADKRIKEDYLRILRYFRFYGRIADKPDEHDDEILETITKNAPGLNQISGERLWVEIRKILQGNYAGELMLRVVGCNISTQIGLPEVPNVEAFKEIWRKKLANVNYQPITLLSGFLYTPEDALKLHERLKLSAYERDLAYYLSQMKDSSKNINELMYFKQLCLTPSLGKPRDLKDYVEELLKFHCKEDLYHQLQTWEIPKFPVDGTMLKDNGCPIGKIMGTVISKLKEHWVRDEFKTKAEDLLKHLPKIFEELNIVDGKVLKKPKLK